jgi:hypothetical protein
MEWWYELEDSMNEQAQSPWQKAPLYIICYLLWFGFLALSLWTILQIRNAVLGLITVIGPWIMGAVDKFGFLLFGLIALVWIMYIENYMRTGIEEGVFWRRVLRIFVIQAVVLGLAYFFQILPLLV